MSNSEKMLINRSAADDLFSGAGCFGIHLQPCQSIRGAEKQIWSALYTNFSYTVHSLPAHQISTARNISGRFLLSCGIANRLNYKLQHQCRGKHSRSSLPKRTASSQRVSHWHGFISQTLDRLCRGFLWLTAVMEECAIFEMLISACSCGQMSRCENQCL